VRPANRVEFGEHWFGLGFNGIVKLRAEVLRERMIVIIVEWDNGETEEWSHCGDFTVLWEKPSHAELTSLPDAMAHYDAGVAALQNWDLEEAIHAFSQAIEADPDLSKRSPSWQQPQIPKSRPPHPPK